MTILVERKRESENKDFHTIQMVFTNTFFYIKSWQVKL